MILGLRNRLRIRGNDVMDKAQIVENAKKQAAETAKNPEKYDAAMRLSIRARNEVGILKAPGVLAELAGRLTDIKRTKGNVQISEDEVNEILSQIIEEKMKQ